MRLLSRDTGLVAPWTRLCMAYHGQVPDKAGPDDVMMLNVEEKATAPNGSSLNIHYHTRPDCPNAQWEWACGMVAGRIEALRASGNITPTTLVGMYSTPTISAYPWNMSDDKRDWCVAEHVKRLKAIGVNCLFPTVYDAWAMVAPSSGDIAAEVARATASVEWAIGVQEHAQEVEGLTWPVFPVFWRRQKPLQGTAACGFGRYLHESELWPVVEAALSFGVDGAVDWTSPTFQWLPMQPGASSARDAARQVWLPHLLAFDGWNDWTSHLVAQIDLLAGRRLRNMIAETLAEATGGYA